MMNHFESDLPGAEAALRTSAPLVDQAANDVVDSYEPAPMQAGMLFHGVSGGDRGVDIMQMVAKLPEPLDETHFLRAWQQVVERHPVLRTRFRWEGVVEPIQEVIQSARIPVERFDWRSLAESECQQQFQALLDRDRSRGIDLDRAPLMRLALVRITEREQWVLWTYHHAVLDGRARLLVLREVFAFYEAFSRGEDADLPLPRPYRDYIAWLRRLDHGAAKVYWRNMLAGFRAPTPLVIARDRDVEEVSGNVWGACEVRLSAALTTTLRARAREASVTVNNLLQGAWALLLHRYSGERDIVFGATRACRRSALGGADDMIGMFINTLPLRVPVDPESGLVPWLQRLREQQVALRDHEHTPLVKVQGWSDVARGTPLFDSILVFENQTLDARLRAQGGAWGERRFSVYGQANVPLVFNAWGDDELLLRLDYSRRRFADHAIARMCGHLQTLLAAMAAHPQARLKDLPLLTEAERQQAVSGWNQALCYPKGACLHERFERQAALTPEAVALVYEGQHVRYAQLNRRANRIAHRLRELGVRPDQLVGLRAERGIEMVIGILGILKSGGAYLPLDPTYPKERVAFMLEDSRVTILVTQESLAADLEGIAPTLVLLDGSLAGNDANPAPIATADNLAYVIYTSGSTGQPKGALITHYNVTRLFEATDGWYHFDSQDVWTLFHSYAFDFSVWELWGALLYGGRLVVVPYWVSRSPAAFRELLIRERVTVLNQTPSAFRQLIQADLSQPPGDIAVRYVIFGGEALELQSLRPWFERYGDARPLLVNMYGITETTVHVTYRPIRREDLDSGQGSVIGIPIPDLQVYLLDPAGAPVPIGVPGEIYVGGAGVARGYLNRPELSTQRFVADPFARASAARLYRSGDLARRLENGDIEYLGRIDSQVKIRGFRIELGEIEAGIARHPVVRTVAVIAREDIPGDKRLVAYLVAADPPADLLDQLRALLRASMPDYMVPAHFVMLNALPLTENGKVDRKALPAPDIARTARRGAPVLPRNAAEKTLAGIWSAVLGVDAIGIHDNFFELGGDSILSIQVVTRSREAGIAITPKQLFQTPSIAALAALAQAQPAVPLEQDTLTGPFPLSPVQHWFFEQNFLDPDHWNQAFLFDADRALDRSRLEAAVGALVDHHDALRLRFFRVDGKWRQEYAPANAPVPFVCVALGAVPDAELARAIEDAVAELESSLSLAQGPILRVAYLDCGPGRGARIALVIHHLAVDGVSWRILAEDLEQAYLQLGDGNPVRLPQKTTAYRRWTERLIQHASSAGVEAEREYWRSLPAAAIAHVPLDLPGGGPNTEGSADTVAVRLGAEETRALLQQVPRAYGTQINDALLAALTRAGAGWMGGEQFLVDVEGHGREDIAADVDLSRTVGWFTSIFPLELEFSRGSNPADALKAVKEKLRRVPQKGLGYGLLRYLNPQGLPGSASRAEILFNYFGQFDQVIAGSSWLRFARERCGPWRSPRAARTHILQVTAIVVHGGLEIRWIYSRNLHRRETIDRMAADYLRALREIIEHCAAVRIRGYTPSDFPLARVEQATLDRLATRLGEIEDLYPLSPMQRLFHSMDAAGSKLGFEQWHFVLEGPLDVAALQRAWQRVLSRHSILRTAFVADSLSDPLQVVQREVTLPWCEHDWRALPRDEQDARLRGELEAERERGFDLAVAPLTRVAMMRVGQETYHMVWSAHHLQVDGWSWPLIFRDLADFYRAESDGTAASAGPPCAYRAYIDWVEHRAFEESEQFWRRMLRGMTSTTPLEFHKRLNGDAGAADPLASEAISLSPKDTDRLQAFARAHQLTLNTIVQAAWAMLLAHVSAQEDVVFGAAFSGRPPEVSGIESMVGPCVNNVPVRVTLPAGESVSDWLAAIQKTQFAISEHQYTPLSMIQGWSAVPPRFRLFDSLVVFQNYGAGEATRCLGDAVTIRTLASPDATNYPFTLVVRPGSELRFKLIYHRSRADGRTIAQLMEQLRTLIAGIPDGASDRVSDMLGRLPAASKGIATHSRHAPPRGPYVAPASEMEQKVAAIWQDLFQMERVSLDENFFDLGGHSLLLVQAHQRLRESLRADLNIVALLQYPTVKALARYLGGSAKDSQRYDAVRDRARKQRSALVRRGGAIRT